MAAKKKRKKARKSKSKARRASNPTKKRRKSSGRRRASAPKRTTARRRNPAPKRRKGRRRRRNPESGGKGIGKKLAIAVGAGILTGGAVILAATAAAPSGKAKIAYYGLGAGSVLAGLMLAKKRPTLGVGVALGGLSATVVPQLGGFLSSKILGPGMSGMGEIESPYANNAPRQLGQGGMGEVEVNIGDVADVVAAAGNPF